MKFVLIAVLLQLSLSVLDVIAGKGAAAGGAAADVPGETVEENDLHFGDLLIFPQEGYNHYAVYVDHEPLDGRNGNENIFEMTKDRNGCYFKHFQGQFRRHNYLETDTTPAEERRTPQQPQDMINTIQRLRADPVCQTYNLFTRNCEQIATKVRYGESHCKQEGTIAKIGAKLLPKGTVHRREASAAA